MKSIQFSACFVRVTERNVNVCVIFVEWPDGRCIKERAKVMAHSSPFFSYIYLSVRRGTKCKSIGVKSVKGQKLDKAGESTASLLNVKNS